MKNLQLEGTKYTMEVSFDVESGVLKMSGNSYPEDAINFFEPLNEWVEEYIEKISKQLQVKVKLNYLNSSSSKCLLDFFEVLDGYHEVGGSVHVTWYYEEDDEEILESGEELLEDMGFSYDLIEY